MTPDGWRMSIHPDRSMPGDRHVSPCWLRLSLPAWRGSARRCCPLATIPDP